MLETAGIITLMIMCASFAICIAIGAILQLVDEKKKRVIKLKFIIKNGEIKK